MELCLYKSLDKYIGKVKKKLIKNDCILFGGYFLYDLFGKMKVYSTPSHSNLIIILKLDIKHLQSIIKEILNSLNYMHARGVCHRDIKPENILVSNDFKSIKIIDFGISKKFKLSKSKNG